MKLKYTLTGLLFSLFLNVSFTYSQGNNYYYYKGEKFFVDIDYSTVSITTKDDVDMTKQRTATAQQLKTTKLQTPDYVRNNVVLVNNDMKNAVSQAYIQEIELSGLISNTEYSKLIQELQKNENVIKASPSYTVQGKRMSLSANFYVKLFSPEDMDKLYGLAKKYSMEVIGYNEFMPLWITLTCTKETPYNAVEAANLFYESGLFDAAEPEFLYHDLLASNDPYFSSQWGLKNTGQHGGTYGMDIKAEQAWTITTGSANIKTAVFDHGFEMNHPDLVNNTYGTGYDINTGTTPARVQGNHGTACAGIVSARQNNNIGVSGVAPNAKIMSISAALYLSVDSPQQLANGFNWAQQNGADIISCSWGGYTPSDIIDNAISNAFEYGRLGKGCVIVFAAGNEDDTNIRYPGNNNPLILVVGAMNPCGERKNRFSCDGENWGSCYGQQLDVMAPGVLIPTTDRQGAYGYDPSDYTMRFNGTSSACPHVTGVAALVLSVNPSLSVREVNYIIERTARKVGSYSYTVNADRPYGLWHEEMGYGLVDAYEAVRLAQNYSCPENLTISGPIISSGTYQVSNQITASSAISANTTVKYKGRTIKMLPGFSAKASFSALIEPCASDYPSPTSAPSISEQGFEVAQMAKSMDDIIISGLADDVAEFVLPEEVKDARVNVYDLLGRLIKSIPMQNTGNKIYVESDNLLEGTYIYSLIVNDTVVGTQKVIVRQ